MASGLFAQDGDHLIQQLYARETNVYAEAYRPAFVEEVNVRSETRDWYFNKQRYSIRLRPFSRQERTTSLKLYNHWLSELEMTQIKQLAQEAEQLHRDYIEIYFAQLEMKDNDKISLFLEDQIKVKSKLSEDDPSKILQLIKLKEQYLQHSLNKQSHTGRTNQLLKSLGKSSDLKNTHLDTASYLSAIQQIITNPMDAQFSPMDKYSLNEIDLEIQTELAEEKRVFDFVELQYTGPHRRPWQERWSLGISANLPFFNSNKMAIAKLKVEREKELLDAEWKRKQRQRKIDDIVRNMQLQLEEYKQSQSLFVRFEKEKETLLANMAEKLYNPLLNIEVQMDRIKIKMALDQMLENLLLSYIDYLAETRRYYLPVTQITQAP